MSASSQRSVQTVTGQVPPEDLGFTLPHEHLAFGWLGWDLFHTSEGGAEEIVRRCEVSVAEAYDAGVRTIVECSSPDMGRTLDVMREVSLRTGMNIVCSTGLYARFGVPYFEFRDADALAELFVRELEEGIAGTSVRAGQIKTAVRSNDLSPYEEKVLTAVAAAHRATSAPITLHTEPRNLSFRALELLRDLGVPGDRIVVAHADSTLDLRDLLRVVEEFRAYLSFDHFGIPHYQRDDVELAVILALCSLGHADRILLSSDLPCHVYGSDTNVWQSMRQAQPNWRHSYVSTDAIPWLRDHGVSADEIDRITVGNHTAWLPR